MHCVHVCVKCFPKVLNLTLLITWQKEKNTFVLFFYFLRNIFIFQSVASTCCSDYSFSRDLLTWQPKIFCMQRAVFMEDILHAIIDFLWQDMFQTQELKTSISYFDFCQTFAFFIFITCEIKTHKKISKEWKPSNFVKTIYICNILL